MASVFSASREVPDSPLNNDISFNAFYNPMDTLLPLGGSICLPPLKDQMRLDGEHKIRWIIAQVRIISNYLQLFGDKLMKFVNNTGLGRTQKKAKLSM